MEQVFIEGENNETDDGNNETLKYFYSFKTTMIENYCKMSVWTYQASLLSKAEYPSPWVILLDTNEKCLLILVFFSSQQYNQTHLDFEPATTRA